jgi:hypothetical protein
MKHGNMKRGKVKFAEWSRDGEDDVDHHVEDCCFSSMKNSQRAQEAGIDQESDNER